MKKCCNRIAVSTIVMTLCFVFSFYCYALPGQECPNDRKVVFLRIGHENYLLNKEGKNTGIVIDDKTGEVREWHVPSVSQEELMSRRQPEISFSDEEIQNALYRL
jgi:hypothetical protein